jgi:hypothetical protein
MRDDINRLAYMNPHFADLYATYGIGGPLIEVGRARYQQYMCSDSAGPGLHFERSLTCIFS